ncbi:helix-turn-helix transcriptional regulator [Micromonospora zhanjiangensis]|uniref:Helix-turn-helix transcriptional regulator n=1 Tax=Micromonospora zhanjiangensis TaxID=1522057 RepID=A0ABV8KF76_9ACTN
MTEGPGELVGPGELLALLGVGRSRLRQIVAHPNFPKPYARLTGMNVWLRADVERYIAEYRRPRPPADDDEPS